MVSFSWGNYGSTSLYRDKNHLSPVRQRVQECSETTPLLPAFLLSQKFPSTSERSGKEPSVVGFKRNIHLLGARSLSSTNISSIELRFYLFLLALCGNIKGRVDLRMILQNCHMQCPSFVSAENKRGFKLLFAYPIISKVFLARKFHVPYQTTK
jgi:hypothetical protein